MPAREYKTFLEPGDEENESEVSLSQRKRKVFIILMKIAGLYDSTLFALLLTLV